MTLSKNDKIRPVNQEGKGSHNSEIYHGSKQSIQHNVLDICKKESLLQVKSYYNNNNDDNNGNNNGNNNSYNNSNTSCKDDWWQDKVKEVILAKLNEDSIEVKDGSEKERYDYDETRLMHEFDLL
jgi:hypothetical protein